MRLGLSVNLQEPAVVEMAGWLGYHFLWIDCEHAPMPHLGEMLRAADATGIEAWVRVSSGAPETIAAVLNLGAKGVIVPHVRSPQDAADAVRAARFHPKGLRNWYSKARDGRYGAEPTEAFIARRNGEIRVVAQVEDPEAIESIDDILSVSGIDLVMTGPGDLAHAYGIPGKVDDPRIAEAEERVFASAARAGVPVLHFAFSPKERAAIAARHRIEYLVIASDVGLLVSGLRERLSQLRNG